MPPAPPPPPGLTVDSVRNSLTPFADLIAYPAYAFSILVESFLKYSSLATLTAAFIGARIAIISIRKQREIARLKETFSMLNERNWDKDLIDAAYAFANLRIELKDSGQSIAQYAVPSKDRTEVTKYLHSILNDYENIALAIRVGILDELYLFRWMRGMLISDWDCLSPMVTALRHERGTPSLYIEFEGLAAAWHQDCSYRNGKPMNKAIRLISVK